MGRRGLPEASTVIPVRQGRAGLEVYLVRRSARSGFMAGNYVFPGGVVDPGDRDAAFWGGAVDLDPEALARRLGEGLTLQQALAFAVAGIRETFEEAGVFLGETGGEGTLDSVLEQRRNGELGPAWLADRTSLRGCKLGVSLLCCWAWWITPEGMKRRYDTRFFLAPFPPDQICSPDGHEVVEGIWITPREALAANFAGRVPMSPPAVVTCQDFLRFADADALVAEARQRPWGRAIAPRFVTFEGGEMILEPWDPDYEDLEAGIETANLENLALPPGDPFSRLWSDGKIWRPVARGQGGKRRT